MATVPPLTLRLNKASPLTATEGDKNLKILRDFLNAISALFGSVFNDDGSIKTNIIIPSVVGAGPFWYGVDGGVADAYTLTLSPALTSYVDGTIVAFKATNVNTGTSTLNVNGVGAKILYKRTGKVLQAGDIAVDTIVVCRYDSNASATVGGWQVISGLANPSLVGSGTSLQQLRMNVGATDLEWYTPAATGTLFQAEDPSGNIPSTIPAGGHSFSTAHGFSGVPEFVRGVLICKTAEYGYSIGDELDFSSVHNQHVSSSDDEYGISIRANSNDVKVLLPSSFTFALINLSTGNTAVSFTNANWRIKVYAIKY